MTKYSNLDRLFCWSLSVRDGDSAEIRERATLSSEGTSHLELLNSWVETARTSDSNAGLFYLETCHRVEIYGFAIEPAFIFEKWLRQRGIELPQARLRLGASVIEHLVRVTSSLASEVVGETQITGQVREAADRCRQAQWLKGPLDRLLQQALRVAKKIRSNTALGAGTISIAHVAVDGLKDVFESFDEKNALVIGAGPMALQALERLEYRGVKDITWINRTADRLLNFEAAKKVRLGNFSDLDRLVWTHSITVAATASPEPLLRMNRILAAKPKTKILRDPRVLLDLGLPRNAEAELRKIEGFFLRNVDEFKDRAEKGSEGRRSAIEGAEEILRAELGDVIRGWNNWEKGAQMGDLFKAVESFRLQELQGHFKLENHQEIDYIMRGVLAKMLHRLVEEVEGQDESSSSQVLETLIRAWRPQDQWRQKDQEPDPAVEAVEIQKRNPRLKPKANS